MEVIIFDLEATCWEGNQLGRIQEIIEIGAVRLDAYGKSRDQFERFVRPIHYPMLSVYCKQLTGIGQKDVDEAQPFSHAGARFIEWVEDGSEDYRLCSWGGKDRDLLFDACREHRLHTDWLDTYIDLKEDYHHFSRLQRKIGLKKALTREGIEFEGEHHRAMDDALNLATLFVRHIDMWDL